MTRGSFFKSLATLFVAPKIIGEIGINKIASTNVATIVGTINGSLISDLQLLTPHYYQQYVEKYGNEDFSWWLESLTKSETL